MLPVNTLCHGQILPVGRWIAAADSQRYPGWLTAILQPKEHGFQNFVSELPVGFFRRTRRYQPGPYAEGYVDLAGEKILYHRAITV